MLRSVHCSGTSYCLVLQAMVRARALQELWQGILI